MATSLGPLIDDIRRAGEAMLYEDESPKKYRFHLSCGTETFDEVVECLPSRLRVELKGWVDGLIAYGAEEVADAEQI